MTTTDIQWMQRALDLARQGEGAVEPNPMVGCVVVRDGQVLGEGWHETFGGPHAEVHALGVESAIDASGATAFVTLEPCSHHGKTPPCVDALLAAKVSRVVVAMEDPFPQVQGRGVERLRKAGVTVEVGLLREQAEELNAPYLMRFRHGRPWVIAKWAMTLDGRIATHTGDSQWVSNAQSRERVHALRARVDAVIIGSGTALADNPRLTARPHGRLAAKQPSRIVCDRRLRLPLTSELVQTANEQSVIVATASSASRDTMDSLLAAGCEVLPIDPPDNVSPLSHLLHTLGRRQMTNVLIEGGAELLGSFFDEQLVDEVWTFIAPKIIGGAVAPGPIGGQGKLLMADAAALRHPTIENIDEDLLIRGRLR